MKAIPLWEKREGFMSVHGISTLVHEMAHLIVATVLGVHTGQINLLPHKTEDGLIVMGSVPIAKTDIFRRAVIGAAPFFVGLGLLLFFSQAFQQNSDIYLRIILGYAIFQVANTCFSSGRDMEGALEVVLVSVLPILALYFFGLSQPIGQILSQALEVGLPAIQALNQVLLIPLGLDIALILSLTLLGRK